jgi:hypothetical protein
MAHEAFDQLWTDTDPAPEQQSLLARSPLHTFGFRPVEAFHIIPPESVTTKKPARQGVRVSAFPLPIRQPPTHCSHLREREVRGGPR